MKVLQVFCGIALLFVNSLVNIYALERTSTGFYYPIGTSNIGSYAHWLSSGCVGGDGSYFTGEYHIGCDIQGNLNDSVYPIADGTVQYVSDNGWGNSAP